MTHFGLIEADFQREYNIDLTKDFLSWRRFITLVSSLSGESAFIYTLAEEKKKEKEVIADNHDIMADIHRQLAGRRKK